MKELSIEEKATRYDEAIERAKKELNTCGSQDCDAARQIFRFFPELKESEDEKIRKWIIGVLSTYEHDRDLRNAAIAWLEKQGDTFIKKDIDDAYLKGICDAKHELEKQGEQNPTDKVEPKFKVGDWVVISTSDGKKVVRIDLIEHFKSGEPRYITSEGRWFGNGTEAHLWDIAKDAKDGDVLVNENKTFGTMIFLCAGFDKDGDDTVVDYYFQYNCSRGIFHRKAGDWMGNLKQNFYPASVEQRNLLFTKMKEVGYEWDAEKKELKKIGQKPAWSEEDESILQGIWDEILANKHDAKEYEWKTYDRFLDWLKSIKDRVQPQPKWSEEDNQYLCGLIGLIEQSKAGLPITLKGKAADNCIDWLKSLKDRVLPQPKQEWNEEDKRMINKLLAVVKLYYAKDGDDLDKQSCSTWLKSLRPQNTWKPSDEQMGALNDVISSRDIKYDVLSELWKDLKKLKEE